MILSLRPGTRQDPLKNSSGLLVPSVGVSLPRVVPRGSLNFRRYPASARVLTHYYVNRGAHLCGLCGRKGSRTPGPDYVRPCGLSSRGGGSGPPPVKQTFHLNNSLRSPCTSLSCTSRRRRHLSVLRCRCTSCRLPPSTGGILFRHIPGRLQAHSHARPWRSLLSSGHITKLMMPAMLAVTN